MSAPSVTLRLRVEERPLSVDALRRVEGEERSNEVDHLGARVREQRAEEAVGGEETAGSGGRAGDGVCVVTAPRESRVINPGVGREPRVPTPGTSRELHRPTPGYIVTCHEIADRLPPSMPPERDPTRLTPA